MDDVLHHPLGIGGIVDRKPAGVAQLLRVAPQDAAAGQSEAAQSEPAAPQPESAAPQSEAAQPDAAAPQSEEAKPQSEAPAQSETAVPQSETAQPESETETEKPPETERVTPAAADVIDPAQIQSILDSESTASSAEVYVYDLKHDSEAALNDCTQPMYASALITVPILYTAASRIDEGAMTMDDPIPYVTSIGGRGEMTTEQRDGLDFPLSFYLQTMTNYSDNNCVNILINHIGLDTINAVCQVAGYASVNMERGLVADDPGGLDNYISAKDVTMMVKDLYTGKFSSIGEDYMRTYFRINEGDSLPTLIGLAPGLADAGAVLNQNGHGMTRYNEIALIEDNGALYILTIMLSRIYILEGIRSLSKQLGHPEMDDGHRTRLPPACLGTRCHQVSWQVVARLQLFYLRQERLCHRLAEQPFSIVPRLGG